jgi:hypothetical protein
MAEGRKRDAHGRFVSGSAEEAPDEASSDGAPSSGSGEVDISDTVAPSVGPHTTFEKDSAEERLARHEQSDVDAMGLDKRRSVVGGSYSPSFARQATLYGIFIAVIVALGIGFKLLADKLDEPPKHIAATAPWAQPGAPQKAPANPDLGGPEGPIVSQ